jgi:hypothetical protein
VNADGTGAPASAAGFIFDRGALVDGKYQGTGKIWAGGAAGATYFNETNPAGADLTVAPGMEVAAP